MQYLYAGATKLDLKLQPQQIKQFYIYYQELLEWNQRINLTSITAFREVQIKHFLDSLTVILAIKSVASKNLSLIDVGSGAGFPGLPLKIAFPNINLVLLEATDKKAAFLHHLTQKLNLNNVEVLVGRAEEIAHRARYRQQFDIVLSRAVATLPALIELTLPLCAVKGRTIIQKKGDIKDELGKATRAIEILGGSQPELKKIKLPELTDDRYLVIIDKISPTPAKYPRRPGMPAKRPIL
jgi:16S rRNA (guanine527-N7)-methyltransferase